MTLRRKTIFFICITLILLMLGMYLSLKEILINNLASLENREVKKNVERATNAINNEISSLESFGVDWGCWDETYKFMADHNETYRNAYLTHSTLSNYKLNIMLLVDNSGHVVFSKAFDLQNKIETTVPDSLLDKLEASPSLLRTPSSPTPQLGIIALSDTPLMLGSYPILQTDYQGAVRGTLLIGRYLDGNIIKKLAATTQLDLFIQPVKDIGAYPDFQASWGSITPLNPIAVKVIDNNFVAGYTALQNIFDEPVLVLKVQFPRELFKQGQTAIYYAAVFVVLIALIFGLLTVFILEKLVLSRIFKLSQDVKHIRDSGFSFRVSEQRADELGELGRSINNMLEELEHSHLLLLESDTRLRRITDNMLDMVSVVDRDVVFKYHSPSVQKVLGYGIDKSLGTTFLNLVHPDDFQMAKRLLAETMESDTFGCAEFRCRKADGTYVWVETTVNTLHNDNGEINGAVLVGRDVSFRKETEERIRFISLHDSLTSLYNRTYFEQAMLALEGPDSIPVALIICDLDGLKFINDTLGHKTGDNLIIKAAQILETSCPETSLVARIGGDEFAIMMPRCTQEQVESVYTTIKNRVNEHSLKSPDLPLSISVGFAIRYDSAMNMSHLFREADNSMYREKMHSQQSGHSGLVSSLLQALQERDFITGGHVERIEKFAVALGEKLELSHSRLHDLRLLARFHDIGKVAIPDSILLKPGLLSEQEYADMQKHCEIGYRIARAAVDLQPVADWILKHHEWWNGMGYPLGLKGEEIPLECRILAIADTYDAMTSSRPYREAGSVNEALEELKNCAGTQLDPYLIELFIIIIKTSV